jgi:hypothetical protein
MFSSKNRTEKKRIAAQKQHDWDTREALLDALNLNYWDPEAAWHDLVRITARYSREQSS